MLYLVIAKDYLWWHYSTALLDILYIWRNYLWFINHLFSIPEVTLSLFAPWKRLQEEKINILSDIEGFFTNLFINIMMRIVGTVIRLALLAIALICLVIVLCAGVVVFVLWIALPFLIANFLIMGIQLLI